MMRELIELYTGLLQLQGYVLPATHVHARDAAPTPRTLEA
jgi:hypothetical protein